MFRPRAPCCRSGLGPSRWPASAVCLARCRSTVPGGALHTQAYAGARLASEFGILPWTCGSKRWTRSSCATTPPGVRSRAPGRRSRRRWPACASGRKAGWSTRPSGGNRSTVEELRAAAGFILTDPKGGRYVAVKRAAFAPALRVDDRAAQARRPAADHAAAAAQPVEAAAGEAARREELPCACILKAFFETRPSRSAKRETQTGTPSSGRRRGRGGLGAGRRLRSAGRSEPA